MSLLVIHVSVCLSQFLEARIEEQYPFEVKAVEVTESHPEGDGSRVKKEESKRVILEGSLATDDLTVSTVKTSRSDVMYARQQLSAGRRHPRYSSLSHGEYFDGMEVSQILQKKKYPTKAARKQVRIYLIVFYDFLD